MNLAMMPEECRGTCALTKWESGLEIGRRWAGRARPWDAAQKAVGFRYSMLGEGCSGHLQLLYTRWSTEARAVASPSIAIDSCFVLTPWIDMNQSVTHITPTLKYRERVQLQTSSQPTSKLVSGIPHHPPEPCCF